MVPDCKMIATSYESEEKLSEFHKEKFEENVGILKKHNASVFHEVDAEDIETTLGKAMEKKPEQTNLEWSGTFDIVWLQLPHTGGTCKTNSKLIKRYLASVGRVLKPNGMAFLTLYGMQVAHWKVPLHAEAARMNPVVRIPFGTSVFPAVWHRYNPKVGFSDTYFDILRQPCDTYVFVQNEFTGVHNFSCINPSVARKLAGMNVKTIADLSVLNNRLSTIDPGLEALIIQAKGWFEKWGSEIPTQINALQAIV
eukprot:TRINITY_DN1138_c0_g2_i2.p1 TRINITY_DN1138_c0_g2~~TRINITY_DN1138_c0_g2_i2.p1  ORF type:complete len:253 (-),score=51.48 TRINITY_DN1138_c0_g2_i2:196-954(-)